MKPGDWAAVARHTGFDLDERQIEQLVAYRNWLRDEAVTAGALGPAEIERLDERHIADSLLFADPISTVPGAITDLGSGVGLPGIPLAIMFPESQMTLVDRSSRRTDLAARAVRILGLHNVSVFTSEIAAYQKTSDLVVSRATLNPEYLLPEVERLLPPGGLAVAGGSWTRRPVVEGWEVVETDVEMLDRTVWLLIMRRQ